MTHMAMFAQVRGASDEIKIHLPIRYGLKASKRKHNEPVGVVNGEKTCIFGPEGDLELTLSVRPCKRRNLFVASDMWILGSNILAVPD